MSRKCWRNVSTPKLVSADPKNTGDSSPLLTSSISNSAPAPSCSSISSNNCSICPSSSNVSTSGSSRLILRTVPCVVPFLVSENNSISFSLRSYTPLNLLPEPIGQFTGHVAIPSSFSISSNSSKVSIASRSILLINVKIGIWRMVHTLNSLRVCASTPLDASITITAESAAINVR